ncbi:guanine nucleotide-binding protein G(I)/G(S)/G(O) subunit gamma-T2a [Esox lucius]|uniref:Guanine nucleotide-binding protein subunit gamma n=1 Tax=Esox lucius TaxID=8010 RepID=A0AAY5KCT0_ESOLU|nr:guanine nucleotide-binding protein G(I)/G(S)/G(O) subunit gamma-T2a [Esox lucius]
MARDMSDIDIMKMELEQLKKEINTPREPVSKTCKDIMEFCESKAGTDLLITGVPDDKNPYKPEKGGCVIS